MDIFDTGDRYDGTYRCFFNFNLVQSVEFIKFADLDFLTFVKVVMVQKGKLLVYCDLTVLYFTYTDTSYIFIVVDGADKNLCVSFRITLRSRDIFQDCLKQRSHIFRCICEVKNCMACFCRSIQERAVKLLVRSFKVHKKFQNFIDNFIRTCFRTVDLVDADDNVQVQLQSFLQNKFSLRHSTLKSIYQKNNAIDHFQYTLYFAAEVCMAWGIDDVDFYSFVVDSSVLGQNSNSALTLNVIGVHDTFLNFLVFTEYTALLQKLVYQGGFAVIDMGDNGYVAYIFAFDIHKNRNPFFFLLY